MNSFIKCLTISILCLYFLFLLSVWNVWLKLVLNYGLHLSEDLRVLSLNNQLITFQAFANSNNPRGEGLNKTLQSPIHLYLRLTWTFLSMEVDKEISLGSISVSSHLHVQWIPINSNLCVFLLLKARAQEVMSGSRGQMFHPKFTTDKDIISALLSVFSSLKQSSHRCPTDVCGTIWLGRRREFWFMPCFLQPSHWAADPVQKLYSE